MQFLTKLHLAFNKEIMDIIWLTMKLGLVSTSLSALLGIPLGILLERGDFFWKGDYFKD